MDTLKKLIDIVKADSKEALGCTEPVAVGYCANVCSSYIKNLENLESVEVRTSRNIYKNGKAVYIPVVKETGLELAAALGIYAETVDDGYMVFDKVNDEVITKAKRLIEEKKISLKYIPTSEDIYVDVKIKTDKDVAETVISHGHTHVSEVKLNKEVIYRDDFKTEMDENSKDFDLKTLSFKELREIVENAEKGTFLFTLKGVKVNFKAANEGLKEKGKLGFTLSELKEKGILEDNFITNARIMTAAAADMRMTGGDCPIVTSGGSGNQGIGVILPIAIVAEKEGVDEEKLSKALFFAHIINRYVKEYSGKLSGICGCAIGAAIGASAGIAWMLGGTDEEIAGAATNVFANLTGMICDGAKESCSMKLSTSAEEAIISSYLAVSGMISKEKVGVIGDTIESTIKNIGRLSREGFSDVDNVMLDIIDHY